MDSNSTTFSNEAVIVNVKLSLEEEILGLLCNHIWMAELEGQMFYPMDNRSISVKFEKGNAPLEIKLLEGKFEYEAVVLVSVFFRIGGSKPAFQGRVSIYGETTRRRYGEGFVFATTLNSAKWSNETGISFGPLRLPMRKVNNLVSGILKNRMAAALDQKLNRFFSVGAVPKDLADGIFVNLNQSLSFSNVSFSKISLLTGAPGERHLPLKLIGSLIVFDAPQEIIEIEQVEMENFSESHAKINISLPHLPHLIPPIVLDNFFGSFALDFRMIKPVAGGLEIQLDLSGALTGKLTVFLPVSADKKPEPEKMEIQKVEIKSLWKRILFRWLKIAIRNHMRSELKSKMDLILYSSTHHPLLYSPPVCSFRFALHRKGDAEISIDGEKLSISTALAVNLVRENQIAQISPQITIE